jgi:flavodoxin
MNTLVVYDSQYGNTERIAQTIAETLRPLGRVQVIRADPGRSDLAGVDMLFVGSPTQGWRPTAPTQAFLRAIAPEQARGLAIACFDTRFQKSRWLTGSAARSMERTLREKGATLSVAPESFFVTGTEGPLLGGELERASAWAQTIVSQLARRPVAQR